MKTMNAMLINTCRNNSKGITPRVKKITRAQYMMKRNLDTLVGGVFITFFPVMIVYCFFGILCNG